MLLVHSFLGGCYTWAFFPFTSFSTQPPSDNLHVLLVVNVVIAGKDLPWFLWEFSRLDGGVYKLGELLGSQSACDMGGVRRWQPHERCQQRGSWQLTLTRPRQILLDFFPPGTPLGSLVNFFQKVYLLVKFCPPAHCLIGSTHILSSLHSFPLLFLTHNGWLLKIKGAKPTFPQPNQ